MKRSRRRLTAKQREQAAAFHAAVEGMCAVCGVLPASEAHHVVEAQYLRRNHPEFVYDPRNALPIDTTCHARHTTAFRRIPRDRLSSTNLEFAREVLGEYADDYLSRYYLDVDQKM